MERLGILLVTLEDSYSVLIRKITGDPYNWGGICYPSLLLFTLSEGNPPPGIDPKITFEEVMSDPLVSRLTLYPFRSDLEPEFFLQVRWAATLLLTERITENLREKGSRSETFLRTHLGTSEKRTLIGYDMISQILVSLEGSFRTDSRREDGGPFRTDSRRLRSERSKTVSGKWEPSRFLEPPQELERVTPIPSVFLKAKRKRDRMLRGTLKKLFQTGYRLYLSEEDFQKHLPGKIPSSSLENFPSEIRSKVPEGKSLGPDSDLQTSLWEWRREMERITEGFSQEEILRIDGKKFVTLTNRILTGVSGGRIPPLNLPPKRISKSALFTTSPSEILREFLLTEGNELWIPEDGGGLSALSLEQLKTLRRMLDSMESLASERGRGVEGIETHAWEIPINEEIYRRINPKKT